MPEIHLSEFIFYDVGSFFEDMSESEKKEMFNLLNEHFNEVLDEERMSYTEIQFRENCKKISNCMYQMSNEEIEYIQTIAKKY